MHRTVLADCNRTSARLLSAPMVRNRYLNPFADGLQDHAMLGRIRSADNSFGSIDVSRQLASRLSQCFQ